MQPRPWSLPLFPLGSRGLSSTEGAPHIGDLNCPAIDIDTFQAICRAPLFPGHVNRWVLVRTLSDEPDDETLRRSVAAVFAQWFKSSSEWGWLIDAAVEYKGTTSAGHADLIRIVRTSRESISWTPTVARRDDLLILPFIHGTPIWIAVEFAYRGTASDMPWPVHKVPPMWLPINPWCPVGADWILDSVGEAVDVAPPAMSASEKAREAFGDAVASAGKSAREALSDAAGGVLRAALPIALLGVGIAAAGLALQSSGKGRP